MHEAEEKWLIMAPVFAQQPLCNVPLAVHVVCRANNVYRVTLVTSLVALHLFCCLHIISWQLAW